jgi:histidinol-phosphate aminotransferase
MTIKQLYAYSKRADPSFLYLDWNEASESIYQPLLISNPEILCSSELNQYPQYKTSALDSAVYQFYNQDSRWFLHTQGIDSAIQLILCAFSRSHPRVYVRSLSYGHFRVFAHNLNFSISELTASLTLKPLLEANSIVYIDNPCNPTGEILSESQICTILETNRSSIVIIDEAYIEFAEERSLIKLVSRYTNLIVARTLSKAFGLAAIRSGFIFANPDLIDALLPFFNKKSIPSLTSRLTTLALNNPEVMRKYVQSVNQTKSDFLTLFNMDPSHHFTNFQIINFTDKEAALPIIASARLAFRDLEHSYGLKNSLRCTIPSLAFKNKFLNVLIRLQSLELIHSIGLQNELH